MAACIKAPRSVDIAHKNNNVQYKSIIQVYTDWANHYLEKARCRKTISDLQTDLRDGTVLADLVEAVTGQRVAVVHRRPKTSAQMTENLGACLTVLGRLGVALDGVAVKDVREGNLKTILTMFFALSKYKQQQKQQQQQQRLLIQDMTSNRLPSPFQGQGVAALNATGPIRTPVAVGSPSKCTSASSSRSTSPSNSFILTPRSRLSLNDKKHPTSIAHNVIVRMPGPVNSLYSSKSSSGDKLKILHPSDKNRLGLKNTKRTSSSSGFSSARSERSDSSTSLCNEFKSVPEKKEPVHNDLSLRSGLKKKALKSPGDSRLPSKTSGVVQSFDRPAPILEAPAGKQELTSGRSTSQVQTAQPSLQRSRAQGQEVPLSEKMPQDSVKVSEVAKSSFSGIPKPTAAVKGMTKPTHSVAPMPQVTKDRKPEPNNLHKGGVRQLAGEEEEGVEAVKPMQPLLRGYKSNITISARPAVDQQTGYMSDGDILNKSPKNDICDGYISEGGAALYSHRDQERREVKKRDAVSDEVKTLSGDDINHFKRGGVTGPGGSGRSGGPYDPPLSPPEPQPVVYRVVGSRSHIKKSDSSQQTENSAFSQVSSTQWKKYMDGVAVGMGPVGRMPELSRHKTDLDVNRKPRPIAQAHNGLQRKSERKRITGSKEELGPDEYTNGDRKGTKSKVRGVPPNFGYIKRTINGNGKGEPRTAQVSAVPRTKVKVSGGTQTDLKSYSVGGSTGAQLSASVRERLMQSSQSLPKARTDTGSLSDSNYAELSPYSVMYRHTTAYTASLPARATAGGLIEADSVESLPVQLHHRASLTHPRLVGPSPPSPSPSPSNRLSRSNSISYLRERTFPRSTKSEKLYLQRSDEMDPYYSIPYSLCSGSQHSSQPTSPTPTHNRFNYPTSPISGSPSNHMISRTYPYTGLMSKVNSKDDDVHGSAVSLVSTASSLYSTPEEKQAHELRKLRRELSDAQDKVHTLTSQLSTNAHVVSAFEQSLSNMTQRLQQLTATAEKKDSELMELRQTIELLRKQSLEAGLTSGHHSPLPSRRHTAAELTSGCTGNMARQLSTDSVSSLNSLSSACSLSSAAHNTDGEKKKKRGWLRSSFNKAFSRTKKNRAGSVSDVEDGRGMNSDLSAPSSPLLGHSHLLNGEDISNTSDPQLYEQDSVVEELRKQLREKDLVLTDIRLEALSSAHQLESLKDTVIKMRNEMLNLKQDNERLQRIVTSKSLTSSQSSLPLNEADRRLSMGDVATGSTSTGLANTTEGVYSCGGDGKRVMVAVYLGSHGSYHRYVEEEAAAIPIAAITVNSNTKWDALDAMVHRAFKDYCDKIDQLGSLGLDCIWSYHVGEVVRYKESSLPDLLPCGYLVGETNTITVCLKGALHNGCVDALVFETLIPKSIVHRYISLLNDHRRIILCGPSGTGKSYLASKLAEFLVLRAGKDSTAEAIATFNVEGASSKELRGYLSQCERDVSASELPSVIILDNLQHAASLGELFHNLLSPYIIGTMRQATGATTNLQLHHNFRWVLCANHMEPVSGLLGRCLARRLLTAEISAGRRNADLARVVEWLPRVWHHLNQFLETHSSSDFTTGPRLFLTCPMDVDGSQVWFTDLWNYSVVPYLVEAVREGLRLYGCRAPFDDPSLFICQTYPWLGDAATPEALIRLRPEDVGYEISEHDLDSKSFSTMQSDSNADPLLNMLMRLQEAANYSSPPDPAPAHSQATPSAGTGVESNL